MKMQVYKKRQHVYKKCHSNNVIAMARYLLISMILLLVFTTVTLAQGGKRYHTEKAWSLAQGGKRYHTEKAWSFGVMGDTRWTLSEDPDGNNPNYVSAEIIRALNDRFIDYGVKFVIQVGDLSDRAGDDAMYTRAELAKPLYDAGIGFFPLRGDHDTYGATYCLDPDSNMNIPAFLDAFPQTQGLDNTFGATNFSSPAIDELNGLSYSFDYGEEGSNARFVIVDVEPTSSSSTITIPVHPVYGQGYFYILWTIYQMDEDLTFTDGGVEITIPANTWFRIDESTGYPTTDFWGCEGIWPIEEYATTKIEVTSSSGTGLTKFLPGDQQDWISNQLNITTRGTDHAFVLSYKGLMGAESLDSIFGDNPDSNPANQNIFYASLMDNGVKYLISGNDPIHNRSLVESPDGISDVEQIISSGAGTEFFGPAPLTDFGEAKNRETQISQEILNIGYYIYTVDGPRVTVDYYSDVVGNFGSDPEALSAPDFDFVKKETWGYSNNGQQFIIAQGDSYTVIEDSFNGTTAKILNGKNDSTATDYTPDEIDDNGTPDYTSDDIIFSSHRPLVKSVSTGWVERPRKQNYMFGSDILSLWGMADFCTEQTDTYVLSMSYEFKRGWHFRKGLFGIAALDSKGRWRNAVDLNFGGKKNFKIGHYKPGYKLGTYGIDPYTKTVWAVVNYNADFAVMTGINRASYFDWWIQWRLNRMCGRRWQ